jgi:hypothetical protein
MRRCNKTGSKPRLAGAREDGKLLIDLPWDGEASRFVDVIGAVVLYAVVLYIEGAHQISSDVAR